MSSLKEVRNRIISVTKTQKITSAMKMVASSKLHKAQRDIENMLPYEQGMYGMLSHLLAAGASSADSSYSKERGIENVAVVVFASNMSLCGSFNVNMLKRLNEVLAEYSQSVGKTHITVFPVGRKVADEIDEHLDIVALLRVARKPDEHQVAPHLYGRDAVNARKYMRKNMGDALFVARKQRPAVLAQTFDRFLRYV